MKNPLRSGAINRAATPPNNPNNPNNPHSPNKK